MNRHCSFCGDSEHDRRNCPRRRLAETATSDAVPVAIEDEIPTEPIAYGDEAAAPQSEVGRVRRLANRTSTGRVRSRTISPKRLTREERRASELVVYPDDVERPQTREDCSRMARPCPFVSCAHHLYLDVNPDTGAIKLNFPHLEVWEMAESCSLDVADRGGITLEEVGAIMNLTRERIRQVEVRGLIKIRNEDDATGRNLGLPPTREAYGDGRSGRAPSAE